VDASEGLSREIPEVWRTTGSVRDVGIYLVDITAENWAEHECAPLLNQAFAERGLPPYAGPSPTTADFEEKIVPSMDGFAELCARHGATDLLNASLIVPVDFAGLIDLPVETAYDDVTRVFSAQRLRAAIAPMATEVSLPADLPRGPLALTTAVDDPLIFYVALFGQAADHSLQHTCPLTYV
jgi:hypothetical protein